MTCFRFHSAPFYLLVALAVGPAAGGCGDDDSTANTSCTAGAAGCECAEKAACDDGLTCEEGLCQGAVDTGLHIVAEGARACDVLLTEGVDRVASVTFGDTVKGTFIREAPRVALSFIAADDTAIDGEAVQIRIVGSGTDVAVAKAECADAKGAPIAKADITLSNN